FFSDDRIRQIFSFKKSSFNILEIIEKKKYFIIKLDKGKLKGSADLLGSLFMAKIQMAAFSRSDIPQEKRTPFYLYIDEFQNFATESFLVILSEARKYRLYLIMAHQTLSQIPDELKSLILGNTGIQVYFRLNRHDAQLLAKEGFEYSGYEVKTVSSLRPIFWSYTEEWEHKIEELQSLPPRVCYVKHKVEGGIIPLRTVEIESAWEVLGITENKYLEFVKNLPFGKKYLVPRKKLATLLDQRYSLLKEEVEKRLAKKKKLVPVSSKPPLEEIERLVRKEEAVISPEEAGIKEEVYLSRGKDERQHKYLQTLIKQMAEKKGYRAIVEEPTPDGTGRVDVGLEREGRRIACEISLTSTDKQELSNIKKCLLAGYEKIVLCSPEKRTLEKVKAFVYRELKESDKEKVLFFKPEELFSYLEEEAAFEESKEERVKGYKVKVRYQPVGETEKRTKREAVGQVILQALRRLGKKN
ncbi:unnamed protein product, partial [marine sediment metagenome]